MKKIFSIFIFTLVISVLINLIPKGLDGMLFGFMPVIFIFFLMPFISGILLILVQNKDKSYEFFPVLLAGIFVNNIAVILVTFLIEYSRHDYLYKHSFDFYSLLEVFVPFIALSLFGGLIGLVIRGTTLLIKKHK